MWRGLNRTGRREREGKGIKQDREEGKKRGWVRRQC